MSNNYRSRGGAAAARYFNDNNYGRNGPPQTMPPAMKSEPGSKSNPMMNDPHSPKNKVPLANHNLPKQEPNIPMDHPTNEVAKGKKFTQRSRLFVGNLPLDITEEQFKNLFNKYGEISETFVHTSKGFGFVRLDTRANAEKAKLELDGYTVKGRQIKVRFASHGAALSVKHISPHVSNELLEAAFGQFGTVERAVVIADDRGRSTGRGIVEFAKKSSATKALSQISEGCFLLTSSPQAIVVKPLDQEDTEDGLSEKNIFKNPQYYQEREAPPRFALPGTFEHEFAMRWKALDEMERQQQAQLNKNISAAREKLELEMENAIHDHKTMLMKQELLRRQEELNRIEEQRKRDIERRKQMEFQREDQHKKELEQMAKRQEILKAQVEGTYPPHSDSMRSQRSGGFGGSNPMMRDPALDYMAGGSPGQGGLGPAPSRQARYDPGPPPGRGFPPPSGPPPPFPGPPGFPPSQRRGYSASSMEYELAQKRRRY